MTEPITQSIERPGATITYDVRGDLAAPGQHPVRFVLGSPMDASGFGTLASHLTDRVVVTYDPRGTGRSARSDGTGTLLPSDYAEDIAAVITALGTGPVDLFASSGGAVNALALVAAHPDLVVTLVAHEPPLVSIVDDAEGAVAAVQDLNALYQSSGFGPAMAGFIALTSHRGPIPVGFIAESGADPAMFGLPTTDDGTRGDPLLGQNMLGCTTYQPDIAALKAAATRIVVAVGEESEGELAHRGGQALAALLGVASVRFPSNHAGFLGDEYGMPGKPVEFAARLREVLAP